MTHIVGDIHLETEEGIKDTVEYAMDSISKDGTIFSKELFLELYQYDSNSPTRVIFKLVVTEAFELNGGCTAITDSYRLSSMKQAVEIYNKIDIEKGRGDNPVLTEYTWETKRETM